MTLAQTSTPPAPADEPVSRKRPITLRAGGLLIAVAVLVLIALLSIAVGAKAIPLGTVVHELLHYDGSDNGVIIRSLRVPRTVLGLAIGAALGLAGALMQGLTRNPLADPGVLGINSGAAAAVVTAIALFGLRTPSSYVWFALIGTGIAAVGVYVLGSRGRSAATPVRLALAGAAVTAVLQSFVTGLTLLDTTAFNDYRFWSVGSLATEPLSILTATGPFLLVGAVLAIYLARPLNALALGEDTGRALGAHLGRTRALGMAAITLLCGAATATVGPIAFVGLTVPHVARAITGPDQRWVLPYSAVLAPILLLGSDIVGRLIARPGEIQVGIVTAFIGAPVFIMIARRRRMAQL
ncbi:MAG TPA: iron chelate uptake ABC transporter family permease subunit [Pseudonocardiaceae bacterium]|nr:iron chelate uptake ABC transporter family permease subunit [Pseudonocardiaceae bacterium]